MGHIAVFRIREHLGQGKGHGILDAALVGAAQDAEAASALAPPRAPVVLGLRQTTSCGLGSASDPRGGSGGSGGPGGGGLGAGPAPIQYTEFAQAPPHSTEVLPAQGVVHLGEMP